MDGNGGHHVKSNKPDIGRQVLHIFSYMWKLEKKKNKDLKIEEGLLGTKMPCETH